MAVAIAAISGAVVAVAGPAGEDLNADTRALVAQLTAERAITLARERRLADAAQEELYRRLEGQDRALRTAEAKAADSTAELDRARKARDAIARQRQELVVALEQRDRTLAAEVRAYREEVSKLAASPDPEKQKALQLFADGERTKALAVFDAIADVRRTAHDKAVKIADAAERRPTAWLAVQAHDVGEITLDQLVGRFEQPFLGSSPTKNQRRPRPSATSTSASTRWARLRSRAGIWRRQGALRGGPGHRSEARPRQPDVCPGPARHWYEPRRAGRSGDPDRRPWRAPRRGSVSAWPLLDRSRVATQCRPRPNAISASASTSSGT